MAGAAGGLFVGVHVGSGAVRNVVGIRNGVFRSYPPFRSNHSPPERHMFSSTPWITVSSQLTKAWRGQGHAATHSPPPGGTNLEPGARTHDICTAPMALCRRSLRNAAGTARRNGQRCRSQVEALERAGAEDRPSSAAPKPYGTLGSTSTTNSGRYRLTASLPLSSDCELVGKPLGHRGLRSSPRSSDARRLSIECNDRPFRIWSINVTDYA
jgi:hypothetical protein